MRIAAIQMNSTPDKTESLAQARDLLKEAISRGAEFIAFPEVFSFVSPDSKTTQELSENPGGLTTQTLEEWAIEHGIWILGGSFPIRAKTNRKKSTNSSLLIDPSGKTVARYDKIHLFDADVAGDRRYEESKTILAGKKVVTAKTPWCKVGFTICYDLRFPELYRKLGEKGAELIFVPSAFTFVTGQAHWDVLTRARAIENQSYIVAPAQTGSPFPGRETWGHTRIIDPWGRVIAERPKGPGVVIAELDFAKLHEMRKKLPALKHRTL